MKTRVLGLMLAVLILLPVCGWGETVDTRSLGHEVTSGQPGTNANPHNLSRQSSNTIKAANTGDPDETRICIFCHTPHGGTPESPLWSRLDPVRMGSFPVFDTARTKDTPFGIDDPAIIDTTKYKADQSLGEYPNGASKLCLSCHDGVTAIGTLTTRSIQMTSADLKSAGSNFYFDPLDGGSPMDLSRTHPISFVYTDEVANYLNTLGKTDSFVVPVPTSFLDGQSRMQCTSCHDPHMNTRDGSGYKYPFWGLRTGPTDDDDYDNTCAACHQGSPVGTGSSMHNI